MTFKRILVTGGSGFIGTNLIGHLHTNSGIAVRNLDIAPPKKGAQAESWRAIDITNKNALLKEVAAFEPDAIIHLAARTDLDGRNLADYSTNTDGVARLLEVLDGIGFAGPAIFTSSMYVCRPGYKPKSDEDYQAHTIYGESKVIGEKLVRAANPSFQWTISRPTSIWGPWFAAPYADFFNVVLSRKYLHIADSNTQKTYGFVGNTVAQILAILDQSDVLRAKTIYLGDWPAYSIDEWADEIADYVPYQIKRVPRIAFNGLALIGDALKIAGVRFPMTTFRLSNMTTDNVHDLTLIQEIMGSTLPFTRAEGNSTTMEWIRNRTVSSVANWR